MHFHLLYGQNEGISQGHAKGKVFSIPNYITINRRTIFEHQEKRYDM
ncbi:MAG TPA: hypothetical protein VIY08_11510 [Candidatus Nitrosocosmicus sp.]